MNKIYQWLADKLMPYITERQFSVISRVVQLNSDSKYIFLIKDSTDATAFDLLYEELSRLLSSDRFVIIADDGPFEVLRIG
jgi:hypothetical protein